MNEREIQIVDTMREGAGNGWKFLYFDTRNMIRAYNKHDVTIMSVDLGTIGDEAQNELFDIITPWL